MTLEQIKEELTYKGILCTDSIDWLLSKVREQEKEIDKLRDEAADWDHEMLEQFDRDAAGSTDLYTWITIKLKQLENARKRIRELERWVNATNPWKDDTAQATEPRGEDEV